MFMQANPGRELSQPGLTSDPPVFEYLEYFLAILLQWCLNSLSKFRLRSIGSGRDAAVSHKQTVDHVT